MLIQNAIFFKRLLFAIILIRIIVLVIKLIKPAKYFNFIFLTMILLL